MNDSYDEAFKEIVLAVSRLFFGDNGSLCCNYRLVEEALTNLKIKEIIDGLKDKP